MTSEPVPGDNCVDPKTVETLSELATAFQRLRGTQSYTDLDKAARPQRLPRSTVSNMLNGKSVPTRENVILLLTACGLRGGALEPWLRAWERVSTAHLRRPVGAVRVRGARPRLLGVHASIQVDQSANDEDLPPYVSRDVDADLRTAVTAAAARGGFVLVIGGSSVGKTRALVEAVRAAVPEWWLLQPADADALRAFAAEPADRTVVWLDEVQRYLDHSGGLPAGIVQALIIARIVVVATMWPDEYGTRTALRIPGQPDPYDNDRRLLGLAKVIRVPEILSRDERRCAEELAADQRIRLALDAPDAGFTQVLAAGPALVSWWADSSDHQCYGKAVITAALDARRVGVRAQITREFLEAAAPGYLAPVQRATAPADWLDRALDYATTRLHGAASTLAPVPADMGQIVGYEVADYLQQHAGRLRRAVPLPDAAWQALVTHHHADDRVRLADNAARRGRTEPAEALYREAIAAGDRFAAERMVDHLIEQGRADEAINVLRLHGGTGYAYGARRLINLLADHGRVEELRQRAVAGDGYAYQRFATLRAALGQTDELDELQRRAEAGDNYALYGLAEVLVARGCIDDALALMPDRWYDGFTASHLAELLVAYGRIDEAIAVLSRRSFDRGHKIVAPRLTALLAARGRIDELRQLANAGYDWENDSETEVEAAKHLNKLLHQKGEAGELRQRADAGDRGAARRLSQLFAEQGNVHQLRELADAGKEGATVWLTVLLAGQGQVDEVATLLQRHPGVTQRRQPTC